MDLLKISETLKQKETPQEKKIWGRLKHKGFEKQYVICGYILDFYHPRKKLAIEIDGSQHRTVQKKKDRERDVYLYDIEKIKTLRISNFIIDKNPQLALQTIDCVIGTGSLPKENRMPQVYSLPLEKGKIQIMINKNVIKEFYAGFYDTLKLVFQPSKIFARLYP